MNEEKKEGKPKVDENGQVILANWIIGVDDPDGKNQIARSELPSSMFMDMLGLYTMGEALNPERMKPLDTIFIEAFFKFGEGRDRKRVQEAIKLAEITKKEEEDKEIDKAFKNL